MGACCDQQDPAKRRRNYQPPRPDNHSSEEDEPAPAALRTTLTPANAERLRGKFLQMEGEKRGLIACLENDIARKRKKLQEMEGEDNSVEKERLRRQMEFNERLVQQSQEEIAKIRTRIANL